MSSFAVGPLLAAAHAQAHARPPSSLLEAEMADFTQAAGFQPSPQQQQQQAQKAQQQQKEKAVVRALQQRDQARQERDEALRRVAQLEQAVLLLGNHLGVGVTYWVPSR
ncbi:hypothetical protein NpPPO83_00007654 [Neofusicoccum parvum]|uniref:Uncharacterized protein n=1 Tax=Neofusicoccum parvum TaxID=310453 RepID=A0ACB5SAW7_9PEZI|nr:hypothetical protein NpPPO83_00007654 [Neofusicoccum parvum]